MAKGSQTSTALIPLADMLNHGPLGEAYALGHWLSPRIADDIEENKHADDRSGDNQIGPANKTVPKKFRGFIFRTPKARAAGDQVFDSYDEGSSKRGANQFCNSRLVSSYGFANGEHLRDCYLITITRQPPFLFAPDNKKTESTDIMIRDGNLVPHDFMRFAREKMIGGTDYVDDECMAPAEKLLDEHAPVTLLMELKALRLYRSFLKDTLKQKLVELAETDAVDLAVGFSSRSSSTASGGDGSYTSFYSYKDATDLVSPDTYIVQAARRVVDGEVRVVKDALAEVDRRWMQLLLFDEDDDDTNGNNVVVGEYMNDPSYNFPPVRINLKGAGANGQDITVKITGGKPADESAHDVCKEIGRANDLENCIAPVTAEIKHLRRDQGWIGGIRRFLSGSSHFSTDKDLSNSTHHRCMGQDVLTSTMQERSG